MAFEKCPATASFYQASFLAAQFHGYPSAQNSTLRMNNNFSAVYITKPYSSDTSGPVMRIILLNPSGFACGFLSDGETGSFFLGIASVGANYYTKKEILSDVLVFWVANRNRPVHENATLELLAEGDSVLRDADGTLVWSTNTSNMSVVGMRVMETGNLVLYDSFNTTVWQSFDHPTDTLLPGQKLMEGQKLVASVSPTNWTEGSFYLSVTSQGLFAYYQSQIPQMYFNYSVRETFYVKSVNGSLALYILSSEPNKPDAVFLDPFNSTMRYMRLDSDGYLRAYGGKNGPVDLLADFLEVCDYPTVCGNFGICSNGKCACPERARHEKGILNFTNVQGDSGCADPSPTACQKNSPIFQDLVRFEDLYYFSYVDIDAAVLKGTDMDKCQQACRDNCSCKAVFFQYIHNLSDGNCFLPSSVLSITTDLHQGQFYKSSAFIKFSTGIDISGDHVDKTKVLVASGILDFAFLFIICGSWLLFRRKKRDEEELDGEDHLDQVSGLPIRFSYEELKVATRNFHKKLGQGGFGSVFEGSLVNGEKIAVKRLDSSGQGKKEFLAEVKTIGRIHHVKLARLIGFCAEKLDRLLVYEFMSNGSLDKWIFRKNPQHPPLDWKTRRTIILDIARGLAYLHEECRRKIVHLDIKTQNILLDEHFNAKISDFGLSKLIDRDQSQVVTTMRGTPGYFAPELFGSVITEKVDVYSFGIVVMEIVCGRKNLDRSLQPEEYMHLLSLFMKKAEENQLIDLVDQVSEDMQVHGSEAVEMMRLAVWCLQRDFNRRPSMPIVVKVLQGAMEIEVDLDYIISIPTPTRAVATRREEELGTNELTTLLPSILSGPR